MNLAKKKFRRKGIAFLSLQTNLIQFKTVYWNGYIMTLFFSQYFPSPSFCLPSPPCRRKTKARSLSHGSRAIQDWTSQASLWAGFSTLAPDDAGHAFDYFLEKQPSSCVRPCSPEQKLRHQTWASQFLSSPADLRATVLFQYSLCSWLTVTQHRFH